METSPITSYIILLIHIVPNISQSKSNNEMRTKRAFEMKEKAFFIVFKELSIAKNCFRPESAPLN